MSDNSTPTRGTAPEPAPSATQPPVSGQEPDREELLRQEMKDVDQKSGKDPLRGSRTSGVYAAVIGLGVVLVLLIIFIAQNTRKTTVSFLSWEGQVSVAVALLIAAAAGLFLAGMAGLLRIMQLRRRVKKVNKVVKAQRRA